MEFLFGLSEGMARQMKANYKAGLSSYSLYQSREGILLDMFLDQANCKKQNEESQKQVTFLDEPLSKKEYSSTSSLHSAIHRCSDPTTLTVDLKCTKID